ncbi:hypothetical protein HDV04_001854 [Boothiomyces sp. JEL0838]|nr:hypothetical protein HDV04_001854 [Boothiomyces sp. JEL0838]
MTGGNNNEVNVEAYLRNEKKIYEQTMKDPRLLLLGPSDSGKSTLLKQMKIIHLNGFTKQEKESSKINILNGIIAWLSRMARSKEIVDQVRIINLVVHFMNNFERICNKNYVPTNDDILNLRTVTQNITETVFQHNKQTFRIFDVSGLSYHRKFWFSYFDNCHSVLYVASLSCYDQTMVENETVNRMADSLVLFEQICNHPLLVKSNFVLFLNKRDLFERKVKTIPISSTFPEYDGPHSLTVGKPGSFSKGLAFFKKKFEAQVKTKHSLVVHVTCCTDTKAMAVIISSLIRVSQSVKPMSVEEYLKKEKKEYMLKQREPRLLLLGSSDSGKSTLIKQLKILHMNGFTNEERMFAKANIVNGVMEAMRKLLQKLGNNMKEV